MQTLKSSLCRVNQSALFGQSDHGSRACNSDAKLSGNRTPGALVHQYQSATIAKRMRDMNAIRFTFVKIR